LQTHSFVISKSHHDKPLDVVLVMLLPGFSRRKVRRIVDRAGVKVNEKPVHIASWKLQAGDRVSVCFEEEALSLRLFTYSRDWLLYQAHGILVINKPPHMPSQQTKNPKVAHVIPFLRAEDPLLAKTEWVLCHRLDQETSGALILAASNEKATWITEQFKARTIHKKYWALCYGIPEKKEWEVKGYLSLISPQSGRVSSVKSGGRSAHTRFRCIGENPKLGVSLIECEPFTGRSHQIRVHLQESKLGIVGDKKYGLTYRTKLPYQWGPMMLDHQLLHAKWVSFSPGEGMAPVEVVAPLPLNFDTCCRFAGFSIF